MKKVSVIMPCFNHAPFIEEAVNSVINQTHSNFELIIIDDASTDSNVRTKIETLKKKDTRVRAVFLSENGGPAKARNLGIQKAEGDYILPLDADDKIAPTYIKKTLELIESKPDIAVAYSEVAYFGKINKKWPLPPYSFPDILFANMVFCSALYRKSDWERYGGYNENMREGLEDWDFWLKFTEENRCFERVPETLFFYRRSKNSTSRNDSINEEKTIKLLSTIFQNHISLYSRNINLLFERWILKPTGRRIKVLFQFKIGRYTLQIQKKLKDPKPR